MEWDDPVSGIRGIGPKTEELFQSLGVYTAGDILLYFPRDYERCPEVVPVDQVIPDQKNAICVRVPKAPNVNTRSRLKTATLDVMGSERLLRIIWFRMPYIRSLVKAGATYVFYGRVSVRNDQFYMEQPEIFPPEEYERMRVSLRPIYSLTKGLSNRQMQKTVQTVLADMPSGIEYLPEEIRTRNGLRDYAFAFPNIHLPAEEESLLEARSRFVFDEFFLFLLCMQLSRESANSWENMFSFAEPGYVERLSEQLPYTLTDAQRRTMAQIRDDMRSEKVMQRLVQGDVGSGKTILAFLAMLDCARSGLQSALMAPTDVLAGQHYQKLSRLCADLGLTHPVVLLTGSLRAQERKEAYEVLEREPDALIVGTHALIQENVNYRDLALVITDEQHRFGVKQRETFSRKGSHPHILVMSATPIPRTLAIILYGDLDISVVDEVPAKRLPIKNCVVDPSYRDTAYRFMAKEIKAGHQVYVICPLVESSERSEGENVLDYADAMREVFPDEIRIEVLHGRMKAEEKNRIMEEFLANRIQILVSTTVIEVGVDVPNATVMMVENAERFGLAQLHQLRGRVGRGDAQSYCILMQGSETGRSRERLEILNHSNDGFFIASEDLKLRGPGDFFGIRQSGDLSFRVADIYRDARIMEQASEEAKRVLGQDPALTEPEHRALRERLRRYAGEDDVLLNI